MGGFFIDTVLEKAEAMGAEGLHVFISILEYNHD
jgi:hypothetical protein